MSPDVTGIEAGRTRLDATPASTGAGGGSAGAVFTRVEFAGLGLAVLLFYLFKALVEGLSPAAGLGLAALTGLAFRRLSYADTSRSLAVVLRTLVVAVTAYLLLTHPYYVPGGEPGGANAGWSRLLGTAWIPSLAFGVLALVRPMFALLPMTYLVVLKGVLSDASGLPLSPTDYAIIPETAIFALLAIAPAWLARQRGLFSERSPQSFGDQVFFLLVAVHFSNYFYAGYQKLVLDGPPLYWLVNQTQNIFYSALVYKTNPLGAWDAGASAFARLLEEGVLLTNGLVLVLQLASLAAIARRWLMILFAVFFDVMHVAIFLATGIFFWKWIILNVAIIVAARRSSLLAPPRALLAFGVTALVLAPSVFFIPRLGWYDTRELNRTTIRAVLEDGTRLELPSNFFRNYSVIFAQNRIARAAAERLPTGAFGATWTHAEYLRAYECGNELLPAGPVEQQSRLLEGLQRFIAGYHDFVVRLAGTDGRLPYDYFPHHIWSNPLQYRTVSALDLRAVVAYELVIEGLCVADTRDPPEMGLVSRTRTVFAIPLGA